MPIGDPRGQGRRIHRCRLGKAVDIDIVIARALHLHKSNRCCRHPLSFSRRHWVRRCRWFLIMLIMLIMLFMLFMSAFPGPDAAQYDALPAW